MLSIKRSGLSPQAANFSPLQFTVCFDDASVAPVTKSAECNCSCNRQRPLCAYIRSHSLSSNALSASADAAVCAGCACQRLHCPRVCRTRSLKLFCERSKRTVVVDKEENYKKQVPKMHPHRRSIVASTRQSRSLVSYVDWACVRDRVHRLECPDAHALPPPPRALQNNVVVLTYSISEMHLAQVRSLHTQRVEVHALNVH